MSFNQFILQIGSDGEVSKSLINRLIESGYEVTHISLCSFLNANESLEVMANQLAESVVAQDVVVVLLEGQYLSRDHVSFVPSLLHSLLEGMNKNNCSKLILASIDQEHLHLDYSLVQKVYNLLKNGEVLFEVLNLTTTRSTDSKFATPKETVEKLMKLINS